MIQEYVSDGIKMRGEIEIMKIKGNNSFFKYSNTSIRKRSVQW